MIIIKPNIQTKYRTFKRYKYRYGGSGIFQNIGRKLSQEGVKTFIKSVSSKAARKAIDRAAEGVGNIVGDVITNKTEEAIKKISSSSSKPTRKQEYTDIVNSLIQQAKPSSNNNNNSSSLAGLISGSGVIHD